MSPCTSKKSQFSWLVGFSYFISSIVQLTVHLFSFDKVQYVFISQHDGVNAVSKPSPYYQEYKERLNPLFMYVSMAEYDQNINKLKITGLKVMADTNG